MKNYKISLFNDKELLEKYISNEKNLNIDICNTLELIYILYNLEIQENIILNKSYGKGYQEYIENSSLGEYLCDEEIEELDRNKIFITGEGELCNEDFIDIALNHSHHKVSENFKYKKYNKDNHFKDVLLKKSLEEYHMEMSLLGLNIIGVNCIGDNKEHGILSYLIKFTSNDKANFIASSMKYLENLIDNKGPILSKLGSNLLTDIIEENENQGREGKNIFIKGGGKDKFVSLMYLQLIGKIDFREESGFIGITKDDYRVDIIDYGKDIGIYFDNKNGNVFLNGKKLGTIPINNREFKLFEFLYRNIGCFKSHKEVKEAIIGQDVISGTLGNYLSGIKKNIPDSIKDLIQSPSGGYLIEKI